MTAIQNPWDSFTVGPDKPPAVEEAVALRVAPSAAANLLREIENDHRFVLDEAAFMEAIEPMPMFLRAAE